MNFLDQSRKGLTLLNEMLVVENMEKRALMESLLDRISDHIMAFNEIVKFDPVYVTLIIM